MTKRGYFIINGVPRVLINQVIRRSGIYHQQLTHKLIKSREIQIDKSFYVDIISQRGTWLRIEIDKRKNVWARMKKTPRIPALLLLQSIGFNKKTIIKTILDFNEFYHSKFLRKKRLPLKLLYDLIIPSKKKTESTLETSKKFVCRRFLNPRSYNLGKVGRYQLNHKLGLSIPTHQTTLTAYDLLFAIDSLIKLSLGKKNVNDIDNLENRRVRTSGELIQNQLNLGLIRLEKRLVEKIKKEKKNLKIENLFTSRAINSIFREFFGSNPLSQFLDQANPLAELTHKRRLTSVGPGGINRETAGMVIRGIHPTHYGRICPIETPEGQNAGLVNSLTTFSSVGSNGRIETPFFIVFKGQIQKQLGAKILPSGFAKNYAICFNHFKTSPLKFLPNLPVTIQKYCDFRKEIQTNIDYIIVSSVQLISVATSLIPFLEHDDANRTLMGSNMQRQAVPLLRPERPLIGTGFENMVLFNSGNFVQSSKSGLVTYTSHYEIRLFSPSVINASHLLIPSSNKKQRIYKFNNKNRFSKLTLKTYLFLKRTLSRLLNDKEIFKNRKKKYPCFKTINIFSESKKINTLRSVNSVFLLRSSSLLFFLRRKLSQIKPLYTIEYKYPIFLNQYKIQNIFSAHSFLTVRNRKEYDYISKNNFDNLPNKNFSFNIINEEKFLTKSSLSRTNSRSVETKTILNNYIRSNQGTCFIQKPYLKPNEWVEKGELLTNSLSSDRGELALGQNILVGYLPWEGYNFEDAILINERLIYDDIYTSLHIEKYKIDIRETAFGIEKITKNIPENDPHNLAHLDKNGVIKIGTWVEEGDIIVGRITPIRQRSLLPHEKLLYDIVGKEISSIRNTSLRVPRGVEGRVIDVQIGGNKNSLKGQIENVSIQILEYKKLKIGDKIAGRHGNKGIVSKILSIEDVPYFPDGTCIDMILNPLGVPSRMNIGQLFESLLGFIGSKLNRKFKILPFDEICGYEASRSFVFSKLYEASQKLNQNWVFAPNYPGKFRLFDGRNGHCFHYPVMSGVSYMMKLIHLVDEKIHARSTGSYSLVTQQPLRGRSKHGGQRFGEMEVWALEGFGVAYTLQELLTVKSDDVKGRTQIMEAILKHSALRFGTPESFKVLIRELQALCLDVQIYDQDIKYHVDMKK